MIILKTQLSIASDGRDDFLLHMNELIAASLAESGCLGFGCYEDVRTPNSFLVLQAWHSRADLDRHEASSHVTAFKAQAEHLIVARTAAQVYEVSEVGGL